MKHFLFIEARVENLRHYVELMVVVLGGLGQLRTDIEFLVLCYALLRMRPLLNSWAECSVVISFGKVDYDKSG
jgi:hypothetical protein